MKLLSHLSESVITIVLIILLVWFANPFNFWMTDLFHMTLLGLIVAVFAVFVMFVWKEKIHDERDQLHRYIAARFAYMTAGSLLLLGTIIQAFSHQIDPWLPLT